MNDLFDGLGDWEIPDAEDEAVLRQLIDQSRSAWVVVWLYNRKLLLQWL